MKKANDAILRPEQASYLDSLHSMSLGALARMASATPISGRDPLLAEMEQRAAARGYPISDPEVACFLAMLVRMAQPKRIVELGTNIGYGAIVMGRAAPADAHVTTIEYSADLVGEARGFIAKAGLSGRVEVVQGMAIPELEKIDRIDMVYIDCVKEEYERYLQIALPKLTERGVVIADNVLWGGTVAQEPAPAAEARRATALRAFNRALATSPALCGIVLPLGDGIGLGVRI